jgi:hypothetical protein
MKDLDQKIIELMDLFDDEQVTTADKIDRPERAIEKEAIDDFMKRNPMAGGGMLVQPGFGGTRQGYAKVKKKDEYSRLMGLSVDELKDLGFTGKKTKKVKAPGSGKPYSKLTDEFKSWVREQTAASPDYRRKNIQFKTRELRVINAIENAHNQNDVRHIIAKDKFNKVGSFKASDYPIITAMKKDSEKLKSISAQTGIAENDLLNLLEDRDVFIKNKYNDVRNLSVDERTKPKKKFYASAEKWILRNSKRYADPDKFYNAFIRTFGKDNHFIQSIESGKKTGFKVAFSDEFVTDVLGLKYQSSINPNQLKNIFKTSIYTNNPNVRKNIVNTLTDIIPTDIKFAKDYDVRNALLENPLLKKFGLNESIKGPIAKLLADDLIGITLKDISSFRKPFLGTRQLLSYLSTRVDPKYQSMFQEATQAVQYAQNNQWKDAKAAINLSQNIMFDHKIPQALIKLGYADDLDYIKLTPTSADFNTKIKLKQFDQPMITLANEFSRPTTSLDRKAEIVQQMKILQTNFNSKYGNYLGSIDINYDDKTGKLKLTNLDPVVTKQTDFVSSLGKSMTQTGEINKNQLVKLMGDLAGTENKKCVVDMKQLIQRKADGGRIGFKFGTASPGCDRLAKQIVQKTIKGEGTSVQRSIVNKLIRGGADFLKDAVNPVELLKLRNYVGPQALGFFAAYEAGVIADDVLRMNKPLNEAVASNWLTKSFLPYTEEFAKQENLLKSGTLTGNQRLFALDAMKYNKLLKEVERIEGMEAAQLTDQGGMGMIDGTPMVSQAEIDKAMANVTRVAETIDPAVLDPRSAKAIENKAKMDEMEATRMAKKKFSPIFGFDKLKNRAIQTESGDYLPDPLKIDLSQPTYRNVEDFKPVTELPAERRIALEDILLPKDQYKPMDRSLSNFQYRDSDKSILEDELEEYNRSQRFKQAFEQPGILGANQKFATGGRAGFASGTGGYDKPSHRQYLKDIESDLHRSFKRYKRIYGGKMKFNQYAPKFLKENLAEGGIAGLSGGVKSGPPPESGPNPQGLQALMKRGIKT